MSLKYMLPLTWAVGCAALLTACAAGNPGHGPDRADQGFTSRMVTVLNGLPESDRVRVMQEMGQAATRAPIFSHPSRVEWNASVTQSSRNGDRSRARRGRGRIRENRIISARYDGARLVFDYRNPASRVQGTTAVEPAAPGYRVAVPSVPGMNDWKGVEYFVINRAGGWYYTVLLSDIEQDRDTDYNALGVWFWLGDLEDPDDRRRPHVTAVASGSDGFKARDLGSLEGRSAYEGYASGVYAAKESTPPFRYFKADVRLTADFRERRVWGVVMNGTDTATGEPLFGQVELKGVRLYTPARFQSLVEGAVDGAPLTGNWGGRFLGNGELPTDLPGSVNGTFGARTAGDGKVTFIGSITAYKADATPRKNVAPYVVSR